MIVWHNSNSASDGDELCAFETSDAHWWSEVGLLPADDALRDDGVLLLPVAAVRGTPAWRLCPMR